MLSIAISLRVVGACRIVSMLTAVARWCKRKGRMDDRRPCAARASARPCRARRTTATCAARASSSPTSGWPACARWPSCAAPSRMRASAPIRKPAGARGSGVLAGRSRRRAADRRELRAARASSRPSSRCWRPTRCAMSARRSRSASPPAAPRPRISRRPSRSTSTNCRPCVDMRAALHQRAAAPRALGRQRLPGDRRRRSRPSASTPPRADRGARDAAHRAAVHVADRRPRRGGRRGTGGSSSCSSTPRRRCRTSSAPASPIASASTRRASASSRPMSAAASATRASCCRRRSCCAWLARQLGRPVRWIEDRREQLTGNANCREHHYDITAVGRRATARCSASMRGDGRCRRLFVLSVLAPAWRRRRSASILPGPYMMPRLSLPHLLGCDQQAADPALSRRGAHRRVLRAWRSTLDAVARQLGMEPHEVRLAQSRAAATRCRSTTSPAKYFDSGDYPECLRRAVDGDRSASGARAGRRRRPGRCASASASRSSASRRAHGTSVYPAGAFRWCRASSRPWRG